MFCSWLRETTLTKLNVWYGIVQYCFVFILALKDEIKKNSMQRPVLNTWKKIN